ncbi:MAG: MATE family efflux transporter [Clostridium sp.]
MENVIKDEPINNKIDLENGKVFSIFIRYAIPSIIGMLAMTSAGIIDGVFVGQYVGAEALAAVNIAMPLLNIFFGIGVMIATGGATLSNIKRGEGKINESNNAYTVTVTLVTLIGLIATVFCVVFSDTAAILLGASADTVEHVSTYIRIVSIFFIPFLGSFSLEMFLKNDGFSILPIVAMVLGAITNVIFDIIFIGYLNMGLKGAALATGIAYTVPTVIMLVCIFGKSSWKIVKPIFKIKEISELLFNGSSELLSNVSVGISGLIFNIIIIRDIGTIGVAAYSVSNYAGMIAMAVFFGIASAIHPGVSFNKGCGNEKRVLAFKKIGVITSLISGVILAIILVSFGEAIVHLFVGYDEEITTLAVTIIKFYAVAMILAGVNIVASMYYTAINEPLISATIAGSRSLICLIAGVILLPMIFGSNGIWSSIIFAESITIIVSIYFFKKKKW